MNIDSLLTELAPRSRETVDACAHLVAKHTRRFSRLMATTFIGVVVVALVILWLASPENDPNPDEDTFQLAVLCLIFMGLLPGLGVRWLLGRDVAAARRLAASAPAFCGKLVSRHEYNPGVPVLTVAWKEGGQDAAGHFELLKPIDVTETDSLIVLAHPLGESVAVAFGDNGMFVGRRLKRGGAR
jgi:hypothetical protein